MNFDKLAPPIPEAAEMCQRFKRNYGEPEVTTKATRIDWVFDVIIWAAKLSPFIAIAIIWIGTL